MKEFVFTLKVSGFGENAEQAWADACESNCKGIGHHFPQGLDGLGQEFGVHAVEDKGEVKS